MDDRELNDLLKEPTPVQIAVIATKVCYMEDKLNCVDRKVGKLLAWKIRVGAMAAVMGAIAGIAIKVLF